MNINFYIRPLEESDYHKHYLELTAQLSSVETIDSDLFFAIVKERKIQGIVTWVIEHDNRIIATISFFVERKFYHSGRYAGHIEDVIVDKDYRHHGLGSMLLEHALCEAEKQNCYKIILDCKESLEYFYAYSGFEKCNIQMAYYT